MLSNVMRVFTNKMTIPRTNLIWNLIAKAITGGVWVTVLLFVYVMLYKAGTVVGATLTSPIF